MNLTALQRKAVSFIMLVSTANLFMGCNSYFKPVDLTSSSMETNQTTLKKLSAENKYFILRSGGKSFAMKNMVLDETNMVINTSLAGLPGSHLMYADAVGNKYKIPKKGTPEVPLYKEVHLFVNNSVQPEASTNSIDIPLSSVERIEVIEKDRERTKRSYAWGIVGITLGAGLVVVAIVAIVNASTSDPEPTPQPPSDPGGGGGSCPYISTISDENFELQGEIYSGALYPVLQKDDYLPLKMKAVNGKYNLKISNDLKEIQYTDFANLLVAEHDKNVRILIDPQGNLHSVKHPQTATRALLNNYIDVSKDLLKEDYQSCLFKDDHSGQVREDLYMTFNNDGHASHAKLILNARTSSWFVYLFDEFTKGFGSQYNKFAKSQEKKPASELDKWTDDQIIPLTISVKTPTGWKEVNKIKSIGPLLNREVVIPLDITAGEQVEVRVSSGYLFWELDYAAIDYSEDARFTVREISPYEAINEKNANVLPQLKFADKQYLVQPSVGDATIVKYNEVSPTEGMAQTFFLHTSGYYNHPRDHKGTPKLGFLKSFEQPGALSAFSKRKFHEPLFSLETAKN